MSAQKKTGLVISTLLLLTLLAGCGSAAASTGGKGASSSAPAASSSAASSASTSAAASSGEADGVVYQNEQYGFTFTLPEDWKGYSIVTDQWEGRASDGDAGEKTVETGPQLSIRDPRWTEQDQRQDIPIMVFTLDQWNDLQEDSFFVSAAPIGPTELGRNNKYVFALPARYNFAYPDGYEEVETILTGNPLETTQLS